MANQGRIEGTSYITAGQSRKAVSLGGVIATTVNVTLGATALSSNGVLTSTDATSVAVPLASVVIPAGTLNFEGKALRFTWYGTTGAVGVNRTLSVLFGGGTIMTTTSGALTDTVADSFIVTGMIMRGAATVQQNYVRLVHNTNAIAPASIGTSITSTAGAANLNSDLTLLFQVAQPSSGNIITRGILVEVTSEGAPE